MLDESRESSRPDGGGEHEGDRDPAGWDRSPTLREQFAGTLVAPRDEEYDEARKIWNGAIDKAAPQ